MIVLLYWAVLFGRRALARPRSGKSVVLPSLPGPRFHQALYAEAAAPGPLGHRGPSRVRSNANCWRPSPTPASLGCYWFRWHLV